VTLKGQGRDPNMFAPIISKTAGDTDSVTMEHLEVARRPSAMAGGGSVADCQRCERAALRIWRRWALLLVLCAMFRTHSH